MIEMNVGLDVEGEANTLEMRSLRIGQLMARITRDFPMPGMKTVVVGDLNGGNEPCLYVAFPAGPSFLEAHVFNLAVFAKQECIAAVINGQGSLIGPDAASWGSFNPEFFRRPAIAVAA